MCCVMMPASEGRRYDGERETRGSGKEMALAPVIFEDRGRGLEAMENRK